MRLTEKVHQILKGHLKPGDYAIDATAGNGHDTLFLAEQVGASGQVIAIDLQACAIESTRQRLTASKVDDRVVLYEGDHASQLESLVEGRSHQIAAVVFNLGYLPGSDRIVQTQPDNTRRALNAAIRLLATGGWLCVIAYRGHPGGTEEARAVEDWMRTRQSAGNRVEYHLPPSDNTPPVLWLLQAQAETDH